MIYAMTNDKETGKRITMNFTDVMQELEALGKERTKKIYISNGAKEPLFGVATGAMKPLSKQIKINQNLAEDLYATGNYDAMYFAGVIADPQAMTKDDFNRWMDTAYFYMLSDFVVAVTLTESPHNQEIATEWIHSDKDLRQSAGWSTYCWSLGRWPDDQFDQEQIKAFLDYAVEVIPTVGPHAKASISNFIHTVGLSYMPLHDYAVTISEQVGNIEIDRPGRKPQTLNPHQNILKDKAKNRLGFKRKYVRC